MFAYKTSFIKIAIIWVLLNSFSYGEDAIMKPITASNSGLCECAAFFKNGTQEDNTLIFSHNPMQTTCDQDGRDKCFTLCTSLAQIGKEYAPVLICQQLYHSDAIKPMMFTRICMEGWIYGNITAETPLCCNEAAPVLCKI